jgi:hypothetical protein
MYPTATGGGDFGLGFYTYADTNWARGVALDWSLNKSYSQGGSPIALRYKMLLGIFLNLRRMDVSENNLNAIYERYYQFGLTGFDVVTGPIGVNRNGRRVANLSFPPQIKFEDNAIQYLEFDSIVSY